MKTKEIIVCLVTLIVLVLTATNVFASFDPNDFLNNTSNFENIQNGTNTANNTAEQNVTTNNIANVNTNTNTNVNATDDKELPEAGLNNSIIFIIAICGISAVYAYKKVRDYNIVK